jgi:hypothetical protein
MPIWGKLFGSGPQPTGRDRRGDASKAEFYRWMAEVSRDLARQATGSPPGAVGEVSGWTPIHRAAFECRWEEVKGLLEAGADPNATDQAGWTPIVCVLFAEIQTSRSQFGTALDRAWYRLRHRVYRGILELLIGAGADLNAKTIGGVTALYAAQTLGDAEFASLIQSHGGR